MDLTTNSAAVGVGTSLDSFSTPRDLQLAVAAEKITAIRYHAMTGCMILSSMEYVVDRLGPPRVCRQGGLECGSIIHLAMIETGQMFVGTCAPNL